MNTIITVKRKRAPRPEQKGSISGSFREVTRAYFARETKWQFVVEVIYFAIIVAISIWPVVITASRLVEFLQQSAS